MIFFGIDSVNFMSRPTSEALPGVLGNRGQMAFISGEQGSKGQILRGAGGKSIQGKREHKKTHF